MSAATMKVPAIVTSSVICLVLGAGAGILVMYGLGYHWEKQPDGSGDQPGGRAAPPMGGMAGMPPGMPDMPAMREMMGGRGGFGGPNPKNELAQLVNKLDRLTAKPLEVKLNDQQKKEVAKQLEGLGGTKELSNDEAQKRLTALLKVLKDHKATLEAAGYNWPGQGRGPGGRGGFGPPPANPFAAGEAREHLKSLEKRVGVSGET
jgi:hypothetical protein